MHEIEHSPRLDRRTRGIGTSAARSRSLIILRTSSFSAMTRSLKDLMACRSYIAGRRHQRFFDDAMPTILWMAQAAPDLYLRL